MGGSGRGVTALAAMRRAEAAPAVPAVLDAMQAEHDAATARELAARSKADATRVRDEWRAWLAERNRDEHDAVADARGKRRDVGVGMVGGTVPDIVTPTVPGADERVAVHEPLG